MLDRERLSVEVSRKQSLLVASGRLIERRVVWIGISPGTEIDRGFQSNPLGLGHWRVSSQQVIKSGPAHQAIALQPSTHTSRVICSCTWKDASRFRIFKERLGRGEPVESQTTFWNIAGIRSSSVVIVPERGNLPFGVVGTKRLGEYRASAHRHRCAGIYSEATPFSASPCFRG